LKNKNKLCLYNKLSVFYNSCLKTFGSHFVCVYIYTYMYIYMLIYVSGEGYLSRYTTR
jgi:hypothetical protein